MFRKLIKKIEQGVATSPIRPSLSESESNVSPPNNTDVSEKSSAGKVEELVDISPNKTVKEVNNGSNGVPSETANPASEPPSSPSMGMLIDIPLNDGSIIESNSEDNATTDGDTSLLGQQQPEQSQNNVSLGALSPNTSASSAYETPFQSPLPPIHYQMPSDIESEIEESSINLDIHSKEELYSLANKYQARSRRYKSKFNEIVVSFKEVLQEQEKLKKNLAQSQDKSFRRISELKEQINLDQLAKRDLEENYRLMLDEKDEQVNVLKTQVKLLKEGKDISIENNSQSKESVASAVTTEKIGENVTALQDKVKRLENLLGKCRETIKNNKENNSALSEENENLKSQLRKMEESHSLSSSNSEVGRLQNQIKQAREVIEQLEKDREMAIAEGKKSIYETVEEKDKEITEIRASFQTLQVQFDELSQAKKDVDRLAAEQLEKSREIIKQLKEEKKRTVIQLEDKLKHSEKAMEEEKANLVQELSRGKALAISLVQEEHEKAVEEKVKAAIEEQESAWKEKLEKSENSHRDALSSKEKIEMQQRINQLEEAKSKLEEDHAEFMENSRLANELLVKELTERHQTELSKALEEQESQAMEKLQSYIQKHSEELEALRSKHQEDCSVLNNDLQEYFENKHDKALSGFNQMLSEKNTQLEQANHNVQICKEKMSAMQVQFESRTQGFETRLAELQKSLQSEKENCNKLQKEMENSKIQYEEGIQSLQHECNEKFNHVKQLEEEKNSLQQDLESAMFSKKQSEEQMAKKFLTSNEELSKIEFLEEEKVTLVEKVSMMVEREENSKLRMESLNEECELMKEKISQLVETIDTKDKKILDMEEMVESVLKTNEKMNNELESNKLLLNTLDQEKDQCKEEIMCLQNNLSLQEHNVKVSEEEVASYKLVKTQLENENADIQKELHCKTIAFEEKISELENTQLKLKEKMEENENLQKVNRTLEEDQIKFNTEWRNKLENLAADKDSELSDRLIEMANSISEYQEKLNNMVYVKEMLTEEKDAAVNELNDIRLQLTKKTQEAESIIIVLNDKNSEYENLIKEMSNENNNLAEIKKENEQLTEQKLQLQQQAEHLEKENSQLKEKHEEEMSEKDSKMSKIETSQEQRLAEVNLLYSSKIEELQNQLTSTHKNDNKLQEDLKTLKEKLSITEDKLSDCLQNYDKDIEELRATVVAREEELARKSQEFLEKESQLKTKLDDLDSQLKANQINTSDKITLVKAQLEDNLEKHHTQVNELQQEINVLRKEKESLANHLKETTSKLKECTKSKEEMQDLESLNEIILEKEKDKVKLSGEMECLRNSLANVKCDLEKKEIECQEYSAKIWETEEKHKKYENELKTVQDNYGQLQKKHEILNSSTNSVAEEIREKQAEVVSISKKLSSAYAERDQLKAEMEEKINGLVEDHQMKLTKMEMEANNKIAEYKKKAEVYISQLKKQSEECQHTTVTEQKKLTKEIEQLKEEIEKTKHEKKTIEEEFTQWKVGHLEKMRDRENILQEKLQQSECIRTSESQVKSENEQLNRQLLNLEMKVNQQEEAYNIQLEALKMEKNNLSLQLKNLETSSVESMSSTKRIHEEEVEQLKKQHMLEKQELENDHNSKIKTLIKDVHQQLAEKDKGYEESFNEALERCQQEETNMMRQHRREIDEMSKDLSLKEKALEDLEEKYHTEMKKMQEEMVKISTQLQNKIDDKEQFYQEQLTELQGQLQAKFDRQTESLQKQHDQEVSALSSEWNHERKELVIQNQCTLEAVQSNSGEILRRQVIELTHQLETEKEKHKLQMAELQSQTEMQHSQLAQPLMAAPSLDDNYNADLQNLQMDNTDLQLQVKHLNDELADCHTQIEILLQKIEKLENTSVVEADSNSVLNTSPSSYHFRANYNCNLNEPLLREPTEFEYLKNILYQYMIGKETKTLAKVIATVVQFSEDQTNNIMAQEDIRATAWLSP
ncbi:golgin subfamily A member 4-like isoform X3 [Argonauta hians]